MGEWSPTAKMNYLTSISVPFIIIDKSITALGPDNRVRFVHVDHHSSTQPSAAMQSFRAQTLCSSFWINTNDWSNFSLLVALSNLILAARWRRPSLQSFVITPHAERCFSIKIIKIILQTYSLDAFPATAFLVYFRFSLGNSNTASLLFNPPLKINCCYWCPF